MPKRAAEVDTSLVLVEVPRAVRVPDLPGRVLVAAFLGGDIGFGALTVLDGTDVAGTVDLWGTYELFRPRFVVGDLNHMYAGVGSDVDSVVASFDVNTLTLLSQVTVVEDAGNQSGRPALDGDVLWVPSGESDTGVFAVDVANPNALTLLGSNTSADLAGAEAVAVGGAVFVAARLAGSAPSGRVTVLSNNPAAPAVLATVPVVLPTGLFLAGTTLFVAGNGDGATFGDTLTAIDVSNPAAPTVLSTLQDHTALRNAFKVLVVGTLAYATTSNGLTVVDVSNPGAMTVVTTVAGDMSGDVTRQGDRLYVGSGASGGVTVLDISTPAAPAVEATLTGPAVAGATGVEAVGVV